MDPTPLSLVLTTEADAGRAEALALALLERRLVACASLLPVRSHYRWQGRLESAEEVQLLLKTSPALLDALRRALGELHSYDTPEWIHWSAATAGAYGAWCAEQLEGQPPMDGAVAGPMDGAAAGPADFSPGAGAPAPEGRTGAGAPAG